MSTMNMHELLRYEPDTGKLFWLPRATGEVDTMGRSKDTKWNSRYAGNEAGCKDSRRGCMQVAIFGKIYLVHRVIWYMTHGEWPDQIDHINGDPADNRICNLRSVTGFENCRNRPKLPGQSSKHLGVSRLKNGWQATATVKGRQVYGGYFKTEEEAAQKAAELRTQLGFHPNHGRPMRVAS